MAPRREAARGADVALLSNNYRGQKNWAGENRPEERWGIEPYAN
jgi:hypothetical protein